MKKLMTFALGLSLVLGSAAVGFASPDDKKMDEKKEHKKKGKKGKKDGNMDKMDKKDGSPR